MIEKANGASSSANSSGSQNAEPDTTPWTGHIWTSLTTTVALGAICCGLYTAVVWGIGQVCFPVQANGSLVKADGSYTTKDDEAVGSALLAQNFALPQYFHPRQSANGYDGTNSGGTNLGPLSDKLLNGIHGSKKPDGTPDPASDFDGVKDLVAAYRTENELKDDVPIPADAVTRSASGLDPHISPGNAQLQKPRVAKARNLTEDKVQKLINRYTDQPSLGVLGDPGVNVLLLNLALDKAAPVASPPPANAEKTDAKEPSAKEKDAATPTNEPAPANDIAVPTKDNSPPPNNDAPPAKDPAPPAKIETPQPAPPVNPPAKAATPPATSPVPAPVTPPAKAATPPVAAPTAPPIKPATPPASAQTPPNPTKK